MTERTTPITVHLTDEQMDNTSGHLYAITGKLREAIEAQRPRPIAVGDRVKYGDNGARLFDVEGVRGGYLWLFEAGTDNCVGSQRADSLTRVDDEATA